MAQEPGGKSTGQLVREVADDARLLLRKELELARGELTEAIQAQLWGGLLIAVAVLAALTGLLFCVVALALWLPGVTALTRAGGFLVVGAALLAFTAVGVLVGTRLMRSRRPSIGPAMNRMRQEARWARDRVAR